MSMPGKSRGGAFHMMSGLLRRVGMAEKSMLFLGGLSLIFLYLFVELAAEVLEGDTRDFDRFVLLALRNPANLADPIGPRWMEDVVRDFTALGSFSVLATITATILGFLVLTRKRHAAWMVLFSVAGGVALSSLLKWGIGRARPDVVPHGMDVYSMSFPSGHAMLSAVVYLTLGALLARTQSEPRVKMYIIAVAAALSVVVGLSRLYLGVHWPTDVLGGWAGGAAWALLCWLAMLWLQGRGQVEPPSGGTGEGGNGR